MCSVPNAICLELYHIFGCCNVQGRPVSSNKKARWGILLAIRRLGTHIKTSSDTPRACSALSSAFFASPLSNLSEPLSLFFVLVLGLHVHLAAVHVQPPTSTKGRVLFHCLSAPPQRPPPGSCVASTQSLTTARCNSNFKDLRFFPHHTASLPCHRLSHAHLTDLPQPTT